MPVRCARSLAILLVLLIAACTPIPAPQPPVTPLLPSPSATVAPAPTLAPSPVPSTATVPSTPVPPTATVPPTAAPSLTSAPSPTPLPTITTPTPAGQGLPAPAGTTAGGHSIGDPKAPELGNTGYEVGQYTLKLKLDIPGKTLAGSAQIDATATLDRLGQITLDLVNGFDIHRLTVDGQEAVWLTQDDKLYVNLPRPYKTNEPISMLVEYSGAVRPIRSRYVTFAEIGLQIANDGTAFAISEPDGSRAWFPCNDHPLDKARFRFEIEVKLPLIVSANGVLRETRPTADGAIYVWEMAQPMAPYLASVMVAQYDKIESRSPQGIPLRSYVFPNRRPDAERLFAHVGEALDWFGQRLGKYPFAEFGYSMVNLRGASLESQSNVLLSDQMLSEGVVIHEMAHMWFGDTVSLGSWADIWRNEGFATYFTTLWQHRDDLSGVIQSMHETEVQLIGHPTTYPLGNPPPIQLFAPDSYSKGAWLAHMLHVQVGDDVFWRALRLYFERYQGRAATRAEFEGVFNEVSGQNLTPFFTRWLDHAGIPTININWSTQRSDGQFALDVQLCQTNGLGYPADLEILVSSNDGASQTLKVPLGGPPRATFTLPFAPTTLTADPNERLLAQTMINNADTAPTCP